MEVESRIEVIRDWIRRHGWGDRIKWHKGSVRKKKFCRSILQHGYDTWKLLRVDVKYSHYKTMMHTWGEGYAE